MVNVVTEAAGAVGTGVTGVTGAVRFGAVVTVAADAFGVGAGVRIEG